MSTMTAVQQELARHALGLPNKRNVSYRNHFVTGPGCDDYTQWESMVASGCAKKGKPSELTGGDTPYWLTPTGALLAVRKGERLDAEKFGEIKINWR